MKEIIVESLGKSFGKTSVLEQVSLHYRSGAIHGVVGNNGAGKSTLLNCLAGYIDYTGNIERRNIWTIGLLTANPYIFPRITGHEFIQFCLSAKNRKADERKMKRLNQLFDLPLNQFADEYSTGMLKKLHLLALLLQQNDLLLLDEPFNGLDYLSSTYLSELLSELKKQDTLILISSHDLELLVKISGTITLIDHGSVRVQSDELPGMLQDIESRAREKVKELTDIL